MSWTLLSCHQSRGIEVRLWLRRDRLHMGDSLATIRVAEEDSELVADEFAAAVGEGQWTADEARALLLEPVVPACKFLG